MYLKIILQTLKLSQNNCNVLVMDLSGKVALVTGSTSGIGLGIARSLAKKGCALILTGLGDQTTIDELVKEFKV